MALIVAPYNDAMRLGMGFDSILRSRSLVLTPRQIQLIHAAVVHKRCCQARWGQTRGLRREKPSPTISAWPNDSPRRK
jgi:hypothetical protein